MEEEDGLAIHIEGKIELPEGTGGPLPPRDVSKNKLNYQKEGEEGEEGEGGEEGGGGGEEVEEYEVLGGAFGLRKLFWVTLLFSVVLGCLLPWGDLLFILGTGYFFFFFFFFFLFSLFSFLFSLFSFLFSLFSFLFSLS